MKFRVRLYDAYTNKQVKQKTFKADSWDEADVIAHKLWQESFDKLGLTDMSLSVLK